MQFCAKILWSAVLKDPKVRTSLVVHVKDLHLAMQEVQVPSLVEELRSHMPCGQKKHQNIKQKQCCNKFNKDLKMIHIRGFPGGSVVKNLPASAGDMGLIPDPGRSVPGSN